jgi:CheY-like chemotaxis protein
MLPATEEPLATTSEEPAAPPRPVRARILIVDDEPMVAASLSRSLRTDYDVSTATGPEALRWLLGGQEFDVIVCDLTMPEVSGMDLYEHLKEQRPTVAERMIFLTGGAFTPRAQEFLSERRYWLEKPVELSALRLLLQEVVEQAWGARRQEAQ